MKQSRWVLLLTLLSGAGLAPADAQEALKAIGVASSDGLLANAMANALRGAADPRFAETGLGSNGQQIDAFAGLGTSAGPTDPGDCWTFEVARPAWISLCGDDDGCTIRLASDAAHRAASPPETLVTDSTGAFWSVSHPTLVALGGENGNSSNEGMLWAISPAGVVHCILADDATGAGGSLDLVLYVCHDTVADQGGGMSCTVRFDD